MGKPFRGRLSRRDQALASNATHRFYAGVIDDPQKRQAYLDSTIVEVKPKREIRRPYDGKPVTPSEYQEQGAVIDWWRSAHKSYSLPEFALFSVPNGAHLSSGYIAAGMLKKVGMRRGTPDLVLAAPRGLDHGLYIEMKSLNGRESEEQQEFGRYLESAGYKFLFSYGSAQAIAAIQEYLSA